MRCFEAGRDRALGRSASAMSAFGSWWLVACLLLGSVSGQSIRITSLPSWGTAGSLQGVVTGVPFATHTVAIWIQIEGLGWWTKPTAAAPNVSIQPNGTFSANVVTGGLDAFATIYHVALLGPGVAAPVATGTCGVPAVSSLATDTAHRFGRILQFAGRSWGVKSSPGRVAPGNNLWTDAANDVFVDAQGLHLRVVFRNGGWWCSEVVLLEPTGFGSYWFRTDSQVGALDPNLTFGAFTWDPHCDDPTVPNAPNREIDFEDGRWGNAGDPTSSQVVVQPWWVAGNRIRYLTPNLAPTAALTRVMDWQPGSIDFLVARGSVAPCAAAPTQVLHRSRYLHDPARGHFVPTAGRQRFRFNLWVAAGGAPANGQMAEVVIADFRHEPTVGVMRMGCGVNPTGSLRVLNGEPALGRTLTLGVDNPAGTQAAGAAAFLVLGLAATSAFPCGVLTPGLGMIGNDGEVLLDRAAGVTSAFAGFFGGAGLPVPYALVVPSSAALLGLPVFAQGLLLDGSPGAARPLAVTDALALCVH
ncbi:MAG: hypothetical protein IPK26_11355 [Planctomycetes bacterium]|nr:hypothetical protein [Planctomycetota bacterium]